MGTDPLWRGAVVLSVVAGLAGCAGRGARLPPAPPLTDAQIEKERAYLQQAFFTDACLARLRQAAPELAPEADRNLKPVYAVEYPQAGDGNTYRLHVTARERQAYLYTSAGTAGWYTVRGPLPLWQCLYRALP